ncbi:MAG: RNA 3'-terminal phosphate cyclase [Methanosarcinales archaeon]
MIEIDGSYGEGGGQIVRTAVALSAVTGLPTHIKNIRSNRPNPGLSAQHLKAIETLKRITSAEVHGLELRSTELTFIPSEIKSGFYKVDIGTAGSISLLLQCVMPIAVRNPQSAIHNLKSPLQLQITGGTDVAWSPPIDYLRFVTLKALSIMGYNCNIELLKRGYYPKGGGEVKVTLEPSKLNCVDFKKEGEDCNIIKGISHCSGLPENVAIRQANSAEKLLKSRGYKAKINITSEHYFSTASPTVPSEGQGSGITLWCGYKGGSALGKKGLKAEKVGSNAAKQILEELKSGASVDEHLSDQLIPYLALAQGGSFTTSVLSSHTKTNIWVVEQFFDVKFNIEKVNGLTKISL